MQNKRTISPIALLGAVVVIAAAAFGAIMLIGGGDEDKPKNAAANGGVTQKAVRFNGPANAPFHLTVPAGWQRVSQKVVEKAGEKNTIAVQNKNGTGVVSVRVQGEFEGTLASLQQQLNANMKRDAKKLKLSASKVLDVKAGRALYTSWEANGGKTVQTNLVVPVGNRTYTLDAVINAKDPKTAREVGQILRAFDADDR